MKTKSTNPFRSRLFSLAGPLTLMLGSTVYAVDYNYGNISGTTANFSINATDQARDQNGDGTFDNNTGEVGVYWRGSASDVTFIHFDLSSLAGATINGDVNLNVIVGNTYGRDTMTGAQLSTTDTAWTYSSGGATPARTAVAGSPPVSGFFPGGGSTPSWTIPQATFQGFVTTPSTFTGFALSAAFESGQHWTALPTLTGNATILAGFGITVTGATDWNAATFDTPSSTLSVSGSGNVSGGNVLIRSGFTLSILDSATLDSGNFAGSFDNSGTLSFASSAAQTLSGSITNTGTLSLAGSGNKTLSGAITNFNTGTLSLAGSGSNTLSGTINNTGTVAFAGSANHSLSGVVSGTGLMTKAGSGTLTLTAANTRASGNTTISDSGVFEITTGQLYTSNYITAPTVTVGSGSTLRLNSWDFGTEGSLGGLDFSRDRLIVNGGTIEYTGTSSPTDAQGGRNFTVGTGGATLKASSVGQTWNFTTRPEPQNNNLINDNGLTLAGIGNGLIAKPISGSGSLVKTDSGTWTLSGTNTYAGDTTVNGGTLTLSDTSSQLFNIELAGANNKITGSTSGTLNLNGKLLLDLTGADNTLGDSWTVVDVANFSSPPAYGGTFTVASTLGTFTQSGSNWKIEENGVTYQFSQTTGVLSVIPTVAGGYDAWAAQITNGLNLRTDDADGDGFNNLQEFLFGTSPIAGNGALVTTTSSGGNLVLRWLQRETGATYTLKQSTTLGTGSWSNVVSPLPALDINQTGAPADYDYFTVSIPLGSDKAFFRIEGIEN